MAKLKFTLNKLTKLGFKFTQATGNSYVCKLKNNAIFSLNVIDENTVYSLCSESFCKEMDRYTKPTFYHDINSAVMCLSDDIIK